MFYLSFARVSMTIDQNKFYMTVLSVSCVKTKVILIRILLEIFRLLFPAWFCQTTFQSVMSTHISSCNIILYPSVSSLWRGPIQRTMESIG